MEKLRSFWVKRIGCEKAYIPKDEIFRRNANSFVWLEIKRVQKQNKGV